MKRIVIASIALLALIFSSGGSAVAQNSLTDFEGVESAFNRRYHSGSSSSSAASVSVADPEGTPENLEAEVEYRNASILGFTFDTEENAEAFLQAINDEIETAAEEEDAEADAVYQALDGDHDGFIAVMNVENTGVNAVAMMIDGNQVFLVDVTDPDRDTATNLVNDLVAYIADSETESDEVTFTEDGTSTGGVFDRMPTADNELVKDFANVTDEDLMA